MSGDVLLVDGAAGRLCLGSWCCRCVIGKGGLIHAADKCEGDGASPRGRWPLRGALLRPGRYELPDGGLALPWRWTRPCDGWSDDPADPAYNRPVRLPRATRAERLQRDDPAYDVIVVLGYNDAPPAAGRGSAIFFHQWVIGAQGVPGPTEGCVAIAPEDMRALLPRLTPGMAMRVG